MTNTFEDVLHSYGIEGRIQDTVFKSDCMQILFKPGGNTTISTFCDNKRSIEFELIRDFVYTWEMKDLIVLEINNGFQHLPKTSQYITEKLDENLPICIGIDNNEHLLIYDLVSLRNLLIAGDKNSGKSVCVRTLLTCLIQNLTPNELKLVLASPKAEEFAAFKNSPYLFAPIQTGKDDIKKFVAFFSMEIDTRLALFSKKQVQSIEEYKEFGEKMPYIVAAISDKFADELLNTQNDNNNYIQRLAIEGERVGIHLIMSITKPTKTIMNEMTLKLFPNRLTYRLEDENASNLFINTPYAKFSFEYGDCLFLEGKKSLKRAFTTFISNEELKGIMTPNGDNTTEYDYSSEEDGTISEENADATDGKKNIGCGQVIMILLIGYSIIGILCFIFPGLWDLLKLIALFLAMYELGPFILPFIIAGK